MKKAMLLMALCFLVVGCSATTKETTKEVVDNTYDATKVVVDNVNEAAVKVEKAVWDAM